MARRNPSDAQKARDILARRYSSEARSAEDLMKNAERSGYKNVAADLKNLADRRRTYASRARRKAV